MQSLMNTDVLVETTGPPNGQPELYPDGIDQNLCHQENLTDSDLSTTTVHEESTQENRMMTRSSSRHFSQNDETKAYFTKMSKINEIPYSKFLHIAHDMKQMNATEDRVKNTGINISDFLPEPRSLSHVLRLSPYIKDKWGEAIRSELTELFDSETFSLNEKPLPADEIIPTKLAFKTKLNSYGSLDKLKARICMIGDMQIKNGNNKSWTPTASTRLLKCLIADAAFNKAVVYQLDFIQAFIQSRLRRECLSSLIENMKFFALNWQNILEAL